MIRTATPARADRALLRHGVRQGRRGHCAQPRMRPRAGWRADGVPEYRRARLHRRAVGAGSRRALPARRPHPVHAGHRAAGAARAHRRLVRHALRRRGGSGAHRRHGGRIGGPAAGLPGTVRGRRRSADARPQLPLQPAFRRGRGRHAAAVAGPGRRAFPARRRLGGRALDAGDARRAAGVAQQPHRHLDRARGNGRHRAGRARPRRGHDRRRDLSRPELRRRLRPQRAGAGRRHHLHQQLQQVFRHDRLAAGLDGAAAAAGGRGGEAGPEPLHLRQLAGPARRPGLFRAGLAGRVRAPPRRVPPPARLHRAGAGKAWACRCRWHPMAPSTPGPTARRMPRRAGTSAST